MSKYIGRRILTGTLIIFVSIFLNFSIIHLAPGDPISMLSGQEAPSPEMIEALQKKYGLDQPIMVQFYSYIKTLLSGDLGESILSNEPVTKIIIDRLAATLFLCLTSAILSVIIGSLLGIYCARRMGSKIDVTLNGISYIFDSMPTFWLGMMLILLFSSWLPIFPTAGMTNLREGYTGVAYLFDVLYHSILPMTALTLISVPYYFRISRSSVIQVMSEDFITTFKAAGMKENQIFRKYVFKNAILPTVTVFGITLAFIVTGAAIIEIIFSWPGMGQLMLNAIMRRDYPLLMGIYLVLSISVVITMIIVDVVYAFIDPRIRYKK
ncbi:ABC transporter permease [Bacillus sp. 31A1R]|uniref:ABC transporter permease n=1 Tax=Robertmurraya mangrovi TaxID=3098077 RepID=A0ABU5IYW7_9BACI|nr:ABC transporter permease [Bacillus sp. 31A1R]MDZ5472317.1 ABC transporter permease [Bacillus sp. 31A1R]